MVLARLWSQFTDASARYAGGVFFLLALGVLGELAGAKYLGPNTIPHNLVQGFSDAFLVTSVLAILVDPYLKRRMQHESGWSALFGYLNPNAPEGLREALKDLAVCQRYYTNAAWTLSFAWHDEAKKVLAVTMEVTYTGINIDLKAYRPSAKPWVLASTDGHQSEYLRYALNCPGHIQPVDVRGDDLEPHTIYQDDGSVCIDIGRLARGRAIPPGAHFNIVQTARMYRHANGYVPLQHDRYIEKLPLTLTGPALKDLDVRVTHPREEGRRVPAEWKRLAGSSRNPESRTFGRATPGQITLISWYLANNKNHTASATSDEQAAEVLSHDKGLDTKSSMHNS
jgi:hypothetical protein